MDGPETLLDLLNKQLADAGLSEEVADLVRAAYARRRMHCGLRWPARPTTAVRPRAAPGSAPDALFLESLRSPASAASARRTRCACRRPRPDARRRPQRLRQVAASPRRSSWPSPATAPVGLTGTACAATAGATCTWRSLPDRRPGTHRRGAHADPDHAVLGRRGHRPRPRRTHRRAGRPGLPRPGWTRPRHVPAVPHRQRPRPAGHRARRAGSSTRSPRSSASSPSPTPTIASAAAPQGARRPHHAR